MPLQNFQYDEIMREYSRRQAHNRRLLEEHRAEAYKKLPRLQEIDNEVASLCTDKIRRLFSGKNKSTGDLKEAVARLSEERRLLLTRSGYPEDYLDMPCSCPLCQDTGYVDGKKCVCFRRAEIELLYAQSNLKEILEKENFDHFSFEYYSDTIRDEAVGLSAREMARRAYDTARRFVQNFDNRFENLFLYGDTGVGKTFLSHCIARELLASAQCVLYFSAYDLFDEMAGSTFSAKDKNTNEELLYSCDLLIIDDLGTELTNSFVSSRLFLCINERIMRRKSTIISTNLTLKDFSSTYSERTFSRIASSYQLIRLIGKDIRIEKLFTGGK
ncbi:MAG: ATP-binding protein [Clostridiales bacterium]|nr:ATP-binding protein [Clostridiales bacterium]